MQLQSPADADTALQQLLQSKFMAHLDEARSGMCTTGAAAPPGAEPAALALAAPSEPSPLLRPAGDEPPIKRARRSRDGEAGPIAGQAAAAARSCGDASEPAADEGQAELPAALAELERSWRALEHVPDPARVTAAGVRRLLDLACAAFREDVAGSPFDVTAQPSTLLTGGASGDATRLSAESLSALLDFCERQLVRRPTSLRGAGARVYDMQAQLRIGIAGLRGGEMSAAMYRETKKVVTMLGITLSMPLHGSPSGPSASQDSTATVASPSGRARRPPPGIATEPPPGPDLPSSAAEYVALLPSLLGYDCAPATVRRLAIDFPAPVDHVQSAADAADASHGIHDLQVISQVRDSLLEGASMAPDTAGGGEPAAEQASLPDGPTGGWALRRADSMSARAGGSDAPKTADAPVAAGPPAASLHPPRPAASEPWRGGVGTAVVAAAAEAARGGRGGATSRKASKNTVKRYHGDGRRSSPRKHKSRSRTAAAGGSAEELTSRAGDRASKAKAEPGAGNKRRASAGGAGSSRDASKDASRDTSGTAGSSSTADSKRRRVAASAPTAAKPTSASGKPGSGNPSSGRSGTEAGGSSSGVKASAKAAAAPPARSSAAPPARSSAAPPAVSRSASGKGKAAPAVPRAQAPTSPLPLLPTTVLARATPQQQPPRAVSSPMGSRLDLGAGSAPRPLAQETPGAPGARQATRLDVCEFNPVQAGERPQRASAGAGAARGTAALLQLMD